MDETKICKSCGRELPLSAYRSTRGGALCGICNECVNEKRAQARYDRANSGGGNQRPFSDPDFDGKTPGEVVRMMGRARRWLESRGFKIHLSGEYHETKIHKLKFE